MNDALTITDELVTFDTAILAKEKGFDIGLGMYYTPEGCLMDHSGISFSNSEYHHNETSAPTQSLLRKWLSKNHKINVYVCEKLMFKGDLNEHRRIVCNIGLDEVAYFSILTPYEKVLEKGLQVALKEIK